MMRWLGSRLRGLPPSILCEGNQVWGQSKEVGLQQRGGQLPHSPFRGKLQGGSFDVAVCASL